MFSYILWIFIVVTDEKKDQLKKMVKREYLRNKIVIDKELLKQTKVKLID